MKNVNLDAVEVPDNVLNYWLDYGLIRNVVPPEKERRLAFIYQYVTYQLINKYVVANQKHNLKSLIYPILARISKEKDVKDTKEIDSIIRKFIKFCEVEKPKEIHKSQPHPLVQKHRNRMVSNLGRDWESALVGRFTRGYLKIKENESESIKHFNSVADRLLPF